MDKLRPLILWISTIILLFSTLGLREMWTQEHRWYDIVSTMFYYHDFLHPKLNGVDYYDKPLLSYWLIAIFSYVSGHINLWTLRLPSALAGLLCVWSIYRMGFYLKDARFGLLAAWMLLTSYYFVFWAHISNADMLNLGGTLFALAWYFKKRNQASPYDVMIFFLILAITALCKGLVGPVVVILAIFPDLILQKKIFKYFKISFFIAMLPGVGIYMLPFYLSLHWGDTLHYTANGFVEVYRENILRYFTPFDHEEPFYVYFFYFPVYLFPWIFFFVPALFTLKSRWQTLSLHSKWMFWTTLVLFLFFTLSGSRRSYYILPVVPFAILFTADWIFASNNRLTTAKQCIKITFFSLIFLFFVFFPIYYSKGGVNTFGQVLSAETNKIKPWEEWHVVLLDAEYKLNYYLHLPPTVQNFDPHMLRERQTKEIMLTHWPILVTQPRNTLIVSRRLHEPLLREILATYKIVEAAPTYMEKFFNVVDPNAPIAFIPG